MTANKWTRDALRKQYRLRSAIKGKKTLEVTFPYEVAEREARKRGLSVEEFLAQFGATAHYDNFEGVFYSFEPIETTTQ